MDNNIDESNVVDGIFIFDEDTYNKLDKEGKEQVIAIIVDWANIQSAKLNPSNLLPQS